MTEDNPTIYHVFSTFAVGGPQRRLAQLAKTMPGVRHVITAMDGHYEAQDLFSSDVIHEKLPVEIAKNSLLSWGNIQALRKKTGSVSPKILCTYNWGAIEAVIANGGYGFGSPLVPHIHFEDGFGPDETPDRQNWKRALVRRFVLKDTPVAVPSQVLRNVAENVWGLRAKNVHFLPNGIDLEGFKPGRREPGRRVVIGTLGALRPEKNISRLINLYHEANLKDQARLLIAGEGPERAALQALVTRLHLNRDVTFTGHTDSPEKILTQFDIFALTSDTEQMPLSVLEAMACGLAVITTDVGDVKSMISRENADFVVPLRDERLLAEHLSTLAHDRNLRERLGAANRKKVMEFSLDRMTFAYHRLFSQLSTDLGLPETHQT